MEVTGGDEGQRFKGILQRLLMVLRNPESSKKHEIFITRCTINKKVCDVMVNGRSRGNIVSKTLVKAMGLSTQKHPRPYKVGWIKKRIETHVSEICKVPLSIGKHYQNVIDCDVLDMDACHILLGRP